MKNKLFLVVLGFIGCDTGNEPESSESPLKLNTITTLYPPSGEPSTEKNCVTTTEFLPTYKINVRIEGTYTDSTSIKAVITFKKDGSPYGNPAERTMPLNSGKISITTGSWTLPVGSYTVEVYLIDEKGTKSNTLTKNFTVTSA